MSDHLVTPPNQPPLSPPGQRSAATPPQTNRIKWIISALFITLLFLAAMVIWVLPISNKPTESGRLAQSVIQETPQATQEINTEQADPAAKLEAESIEQDWFAEKARAELDNMPQWGTEDYQAALALAQTGHEQLASEKFSQAIRSFESAFEKIYALDNSKNTRRQEAIAAGQKALDEFMETEAMQQFSIALALDPANDVALIGTQRAATITQVASMLQEAKKFIKTGDLNQAHKTLLTINQIDPLFQEAKLLLQNTEKLLERRAFDQAIGMAIAAFTQQNFKQSHTYLKEAAKIFPTHKSVKELRRRLLEAEKSNNLQEKLAKAAEHEREEEWAAAIQAYEQAQTVAPQSVAARKGLAQAEQSLALETALRKIISQPQRLTESAPLQEANETLRQAKATHQIGPQLAALIDQTTTIINRAAQPVQVTFTSDNQTEVTIFHIGRLGKFSKRTISIKPGSYTVTGTRIGYRDIRKELQVQPANSRANQFHIVCEEKI